MILETRDQVPHQAPMIEYHIMPASPYACISASLSLCVTIINKFKKIKKKKCAMGLPEALLDSMASTFTTLQKKPTELQQISY